MVLPANAQVTSDGTTNTIVNPTGNNFTILNGIEKGSNLFHSFSNFSVPTGGSAIFDPANTPHITTIFNRVTGGNVSNIDGTIYTTGNTTLGEQSSIKTTNGGNIGIVATNLQIAGGSSMIADTAGANRAGNIDIKAAERVDIIGNSGTSVSRLEAVVGATATGNGGKISAETNGAGNAGSIKIEAARFVEVTGTSPLQLRYNHV